MHLLQCCNVGDVLGGTAACAWSLARALEGCRHTVGFFGAVTDETRRAFGEWEVLELGRLEARDVRRLGVDAVVLHNTPGWRVLGPLPAVTLAYLHSQFRGAYAGDATAYCSRWLARRYGADERFVLYQGVEVAEEKALRDAEVSTAGQASSGTRRGGNHAAVSPSGDRGTTTLWSPPHPAPPHEGGGSDCWKSAKSQAGGLMVGRLCTPRGRKWPAKVVEFYGELAGRLPAVRWEFVGCPAELRGRLAEACMGRARFLEARWQARSLLRHWDVWCYSNPELPESFGRVCAEAMMAGCVPVVDRLGGFCEQVEEGVSGFLCESVEEFAEALGRLRDPSVLQRMAEAARERAQRMFALRAFGQRVLTWLEAVARSSRPGDMLETNSHVA